MIGFGVIFACDHPDALQNLGVKLSKQCVFHTFAVNLQQVHVRKCRII